MALKHELTQSEIDEGFGSIRNNMALKRIEKGLAFANRFGSIRNNMALKLDFCEHSRSSRFGSIRNNMALKPRRT